MNNLKPCPFCGGDAEWEYTGDNVQIQCEDCLCSTFDCSDPVAIKKVWSNRHYEERLKQAFLAGMDCYEYVEKTGVPQDDAFDQWLEYIEDKS